MLNRIHTAIGWRVRYRLIPFVKRLGARWIPAGKAAPYDFDRARAYWQNVPRAEGGNPFNSAAVAGLSDEALAAEFDREAALAREKHERRVGFALAEDSLCGLSDPRVMDYGSGIGFYGFEVLARHPGARVTFVDINPANLDAIGKIARAKGLTGRVSGVCVMAPDARDLRFDEPFDFMMSMGVLHHTPHAPAIVRNLTRWLKPGGVFEVMLYNEHYLRRMAEAAGRALNETRFGAVTDPVVGGVANPYSEAYDEAKTRALFSGYEMISLDQPDPCYDVYRFRKAVEPEDRR
jgi:2-polyprenyl-3-methyl-5-hydroxy-6-metoxy-1,4-benzoquinol methylase